ncbi:MAG TPA: peptidoglycan editing factor PgeF [Lachnospiraceae bacterium]|nr:peptidoglycan editing factor PgeF [Lachnospiraceae bacterium]
MDGLSDINGIKYGFTTRLGGVSTGIYKSLNMGFYLGDDRENVLENYNRVGSAMDIDITRMSCPNQVHKSEVLVVTEEDAGDGITRELTHSEIDAQITNVKNLPLIVYTADCVPILFADPVSRVIGTSHAGWRGSVAGIAAKTVNKMKEVYGCLPENIIAIIGPSIGPDNYEVDETVIKEIYNSTFIDSSSDNIVTQNIGNKDQEVFIRSGSYVNNVRSIPKDYEGMLLTHPGALYSIYRTVSVKQRYMLNLWNLNELILVNAGLKVSNIYQTKLCTMKNHEMFFSHRYTNGKRGLNAGIISL